MVSSAQKLPAPQPAVTSPSARPWMNGSAHCHEPPRPAVGEGHAGGDRHLDLTVRGVVLDHEQGFVAPRRSTGRIDGGIAVILRHRRD